ncbi:hypothetical protein OHT20_38135 [Streptomyces caniferus]|uniref:hypothetical protein n=1 Tax=Streptomyces caniferus TaxID=285557 RepID=UPI002E2CCB3C|nr:hypothetical protein [Streptomyces caniferus]
MRKDHQLRRLAVGEDTWLWSVRHKHPPCREILSLHHAATRTTLRIVFHDRPGRLVPDGVLHSGAVGDRRGVLNLHEPGVVRRLVDELAAQGRLPTAPGDEELDGWPLFDALVARDGD